MTRIENVRKSGFADEVIIEETVGQRKSVMCRNITLISLQSSSRLDRGI